MSTMFIAGSGESLLECEDPNRLHQHVVALGMVGDAGVYQCCGKGNVGGIADGIIGDNGGHGLSVDFENHLRGSPEDAVLMKARGEVVRKVSAPTHTGILPEVVALGGYCWRGAQKKRPVTSGM